MFEGHSVHLAVRLCAQPGWLRTEGHLSAGRTLQEDRNSGFFITIYSVLCDVSAPKQGLLQHTLERLALAAERYLYNVNDSYHHKTTPGTLAPAICAVGRTLTSKIDHVYVDVHLSLSSQPRRA